jgi:hypothetical protein
MKKGPFRPTLQKKFKKIRIAVVTSSAKCNEGYRDEGKEGGTAKTSKKVLRGCNSGAA